MLRIEINTDGAAFVDDPAEIARILRGLAMNFENGTLTEAFGGRLRDTNGNVCGSYSYDPPAE